MSRDYLKYASMKCVITYTHGSEYPFTLFVNEEAIAYDTSSRTLANRCFDGGAQAVVFDFDLRYHK